jgi:hypothetical protein
MKLFSLSLALLILHSVLPSGFALTLWEQKRYQGTEAVGGSLNEHKLNFQTQSNSADMIKTGQLGGRDLRADQLKEMHEIMKTENAEVQRNLDLAKRFNTNKQSELPLLLAKEEGKSETMKDKEKIAQIKKMIQETKTEEAELAELQKVMDGRKLLENSAGESARSTSNAIRETAEWGKLPSEGADVYQRIDKAGNQTLYNVKAETTQTGQLQYTYSGEGTAGNSSLTASWDAKSSSWKVNYPDGSTGSLSQSGSWSYQEASAVQAAQVVSPTQIKEATPATPPTTPPPQQQPVRTYISPAPATCGQVWDESKKKWVYRCPHQ